MELRIRDKPYVDEAALKKWGPLQKVEVLAELLRAEVTARASSPRSSVIRRVHEAVSQPATVERDRIAEVCGQLEKEGDFTTSSGGMLHVTPVRVVQLEETQFRLFSSLPTSLFTPELSKCIERVSASRVLTLDGQQATSFEENVSRMGGLILSPHEWAGFATQPRADECWLNVLEERLNWLPEAAGSLKRDGQLEWRGLVFSDDGAKFLKKAGASARLWRAKSHFGRWLWAWGTPSQTPCTASFLALNSDEAARTLFSLARTLERPIIMRLNRASEQPTLEIDSWLPRAEYRYLSVLATPQNIAVKNAWSVPNMRLEEVLATLKDRLGLSVQETGDA